MKTFEDLGYILSTESAEVLVFRNENAGVEITINFNNRKVFKWNIFGDPVALTFDEIETIEKIRYKHT